MENITTPNNRYIFIDYLRGFLTVLVVLYHSLLTYTSNGYASMIADVGKWAGFDTVVQFLDIFFMSLFFFVSGLFSLKSIERKGAWVFLRGRLLRLGIPFVIGWLVINIPAYYLSYGAYYQFMYGVPMSIAGFFKYWGESLGGSTAGPLWFLWVLLLFDCLIAATYKVFPRILKKIRTCKCKLLTNHWRFITGMVLLALIFYLPMLNVGDNKFVHLFGPFNLQISRILLYLMFFVFGAVIGIYRMNKSVLSRNGKLIKRWWILLLVGVLSYLVLQQFQTWSVADNQIDKWYVLYPIAVLFVVICITVSMGLLGAFSRLVNKENKVLRSLADNAYGIYILHYVIVAAMQFVFIKIALHGVSKGIIVFVFSLFITWGFVWLLRRAPAVRKITG